MGCCCCPRSRRLRTTHSRRRPSPSRRRHIRHVRKRIRMWPGTHLNRRTARLCMGGGGECLGLRARAGLRGGIRPGARAGEMSERRLRVRLGAGLRLGLRLRLRLRLRIEHIRCGHGWRSGGNQRLTTLSRGCSMRQRIPTALHSLHFLPASIKATHLHQHHISTKTPAIEHTTLALPSHLEPKNKGIHNPPITHRPWPLRSRPPLFNTLSILIPSCVSALPTRALTLRVSGWEPARGQARSSEEGLE